MVRRLASHVVTDTKGGLDLGVHPDVLESLHYTRLDQAAEAEEREGVASGLPPPPLEAGQPSEAAAFYSRYFHSSAHARVTRGFDFRRRQFWRAIMDLPGRWKGLLVRHCPRSGEFSLVGQVM